jgi:hypothetical protein
MFQKTTKPEKELPEWDKAALAYAKSRLNDDGTIGAIVKAGHAGDEWVRYFKHIKMRSRASFIDHLLRNGGSATLPTEFPHEYDPTFVPAIYRPDKTDKKAQKNRPPVEDRLRWWDK